MAATIALFVLLAVASVTDLRWRKIYNWTTYPGILLALGANAAATLAGWETAPQEAAAFTWHGLIGLPDSAAGMVLCGMVMVVSYVFFAGGVGAGDVKLMAMIGAFLGMMEGLEAMLWTFILGGCLALIVLVWRVGLLQLLGRVGRYAMSALRLKTFPPLTEEERQPLKAPLFLSPSAALATAIVHFRLLEIF